MAKQKEPAKKELQVKFYTAIERYDETRSIADSQTLIICWLKGYLVSDKNNLLHRKYLVEGSSEEKAARAAVADALRRNILCDNDKADLADLIEGRTERKVRILFRSKNRVRNEANSEIASFIRGRLEAGDKLEEAVNDASEKFNKQSSRIYEIWARYGPILEAAFGPVRSSI
jgi:hypothetical protein